MTPLLDATKPEDFDVWLTEHPLSEPMIWVAIDKKAMKKRTVTFDELFEVALCHGWVDVQTKGIDTERLGIPFVRRNIGSNW